jgi:hypothetical protein
VRSTDMIPSWRRGLILEARLMLLARLGFPWENLWREERPVEGRIDRGGKNG